jgi:D-glycero-D-manno-heptose 1,7-bisphosphate phosphatase
MPQVREKLRSMDWTEGGAKLGIASNQNGVALGYLTQETARQLIVETLMAALGSLPHETVIEMCVCHPGVQCRCRKPAPGMLLDIMQKLKAEPADTLYIGDLELDREAAARAGTRFAWAWDFFGWTHDRL